MTTAAYKKPLPRPENKELTKPYWDAIKRHELHMQRCKSCDRLIFYPREQCPFCLSQDLDYAPVSGRGRVHAYTIVHQPADSNFAPDAPYVFALIQLDEGVRMISNVIDCDPNDVHIDMPVVATYEDVTPDWTLVKFKPA
jgi:uncharacterized OB-fold protein